MTVGTKTYPFPDDFAAAMALPAYEFKSLFGRQVVKGWDDLRQIEAFLRTVRPTYILELGCGDGVQAVYLAMYAQLNRVPVKRARYCSPPSCQPVVFACDAGNVGHDIRKALPLWGDAYGGIDVYDGDRRRWVVSQIPRAADPDGCGERVMLYLDIGPPDLETFAPDVPVGGYVIVHDWKHKGYQESADRLVNSGVLAYFERDVWERTGAHMGFIRTDGAQGADGADGRSDDSCES